MNKLLLLLSFGFGTVITVPDDYSTIQEGIDAAVDGDTVLVDQGEYYENLIIQKTITLTSYAIYDDLSEWVLNAGEYYINNDNILNTRIDGSNDTNGEGFESTILINSPDDECISPIIFGFTITGGDGTLVPYEDDEGNDIEETRGGGFLSYNALPILNYNFIKDNDDGDIESGGGGDQSNGDQFRDAPHGYTFGRPRCEGNVDLSFNFYRNNDALYGNTLSTNGFEGSLDMTNSIFDVYNCPDTTVTPVWVDVEEEVEVDFEDGEGDVCSIAEDVWVSPDGDDYVNTGTSQDNAFRTIEVALELIAPDSLNPITINLTEGTFSPSTTGESFPIVMVSNVNLIGAGEEVTILDAEQTDRVITMDYCDNNIISDFTITGGLAEGDYPDNRGGGIYLDNSDPILTNITISNNTTDTYGGGMSLSDSNPILTNITISNNTADDGGGMYLNHSDPILNHVTISNNTADAGGGMLLSFSDPILTNVTITNNTAESNGGGMDLWDSNPILNNVTITNNTAESNGGGMDLFYSDPILNNVTILNNTANYGGGMYLGNSTPTLTHVTIANNMAENDGGGMYLYNSDPNMTNVTITGNTAESYGGGMRLNYSDPILTNSIIWGNSPESIYISSGTPIITYSDIEGGWEGEGNIDLNPLFTDPENDDYTLQAGSPCIDAGTVIEDMEYCGEAPDMGAYEYITEDCYECDAALGDVNGDSEINILDLVQIANLILETSTPAYECAADYTGDGQVNILDLVQIANYIISTS